MSTENQILKCPYCGGEIQHSPNQGGVEKHTCKNCGYEFYVENENSKEKLFALNSFRNEVINLLHAKIDGGKEKRIENWKKNEKKLEEYIEQCGGDSNDDPLFAIARAAHITDGFEQYLPKEEKVTVEALYHIANDYVRKNKKATNIKELIRLYKWKLRNKVFNLVLMIGGGVLAALAIAFMIWAIIMGQKVPVVIDSNTGISISIPKDAVSMFDKMGIDIHVEKQSTNSVAYIDAKNALHNETEKFELYDLSLLKKQAALNFDGSVTVEIPIPDGYLPGALKVYHVVSDEKFEEVHSTVSTARNTISFKTDHFSYYAVAERHPIVVFDTDGAGEIDRQIIQRDTLAQKPQDPQKEGYTFAGWMLGNAIWKFDSDTVKKDMVLKAKWIPNEYTITLVANGAVLSTNTLKISYKDTYSALPTNVTKTGFTFVGWYTAPEKGLLVTNDMIMQTAADQTLYAIFVENTNRVIFNANGGNGEMLALELSTGESAKLPKNTFTKAGHTFMGWSTSVTGDVVFADNAEYTMGVLSQNILYAVWEINTNTVKFDANGGEGSMESVYWDYNTTNRLPENTFVRIGYSFIGWSTTPNGEVVFENKDEYTMGEKSEYVLYAQWRVGNNKLHFDPNGGSGSMNYVEVEYNQFFHLPQNQFYREGYTFIGWSTSQTGEKLYGDQAEYQMGPNSDYTLYALWVGNANAFIFNANGGSGFMPTDFTIATGTTANLPTNRFTRNGYTFIGWSTDEHGIVKYTDGTEYTQETSKTVELYAVWQVIEYKITFNSNGGNSVSEKTYTAEDTVAFSETTKTGYTFVGWYESTDFVGDAVTVLDVGNFGHKTYYAKWEAITYEIIYESNGGSYIDPQYYNIEIAISNLPTPTRDGYNFAGWYQNSDFSGAQVAEIAMGTYGDIQLYAKWNLISYTITFNVNGGDSLANMTFTIESEWFRLPEPTRTGFAFDGWYKDSAFLTEAVDGISQGSYGDITFYAKWVSNGYTIQYDSMGGTEIRDTVYTVETETFTLSEPTRVGYTFAGWYDNESYTGSAITTIEKGSIGDKFLYAKWNLVTYTITFDSKGGSNVPSVSYNIESDTFGFTDPERAGYEFAGWYQNAACTGNPVSAIETGTHESITLYAKWTLVQYEIVFETNGGSYISTITYNAESNPITLRTPTKNGYEFLGWYADEEFSGDKVETIATGSIGDRTYYAKWSTPIEYSITFHVGDGSEVTTIYYNVESETFELPTSTQIGYDFVGWYKKSNYTGGVVTEIPQGTYGDIVLYAKWQIKTYIIEFDTNEGNAISDKSYNIQSEYTLPTPTRTGYTFAGWYDNEGLIGNPITKILVGSTGNRYFWAAWTANTYTVIYQPNGGVGTMDASGHVYGEGKELNTNTFTREHYEFAGWGLSKDGPVVYGNQDWVENLTTNGTVVLYAQWIPKTYTVNFVTNGGDPIDTITYTIEDAVELPKGVREGFIFGGWFETEDCSGAVIKNLPKGTYGDKIFYCGEWKSAHFTITFYPTGGTMTNLVIHCTLDPNDPQRNKDCIYIDDVKFETPKWPEYVDYNHFLGWLVDNDPSKKFKRSDLETWVTAEELKNLNLYADWDLLDVVYDGVSQLPKETVSSVDRILIDLSDHNSETLCDQVVFFDKPTEVIFIGHESATYTDLCIEIEATNVMTNLILVDFNMKGRIVINGSSTTITCKGNNSVISNTTANAAITGFINLTFAGDGKLTVKGKDGGTGVNGGIGIQVNNRLTFSDEIDVTVYGGNGGDGVDQPKSSKEGSSGAAGGNAGHGGDAIVAETVFIHGIHLVAYGGKGGEGGKGGDANGKTASWNSYNGGNGGAGGKGAYAINATESISAGMNAVVNVEGGDGGNGGNGGGGSKEGANGKTGYGGAGGLGSKAANIEISISNAIVDTQVGIDGTKGTGR